MAIPFKAMLIDLNTYAKEFQAKSASMLDFLLTNQAVSLGR
jgi:hypothetical protein